MNETRIFKLAFPQGMSGYRSNGGTATALAFAREGVCVGFPWITPQKTRFAEDPGHLGPGHPCFSLTCHRCRKQEFMPYGIATVRLYVGAVKRVALPIVSQAINPQDASGFPQE